MALGCAYIELLMHLGSLESTQEARVVFFRSASNFFCVRQVYFTKSCQQIWVRVNQPFIPFINHIWGETVLWGIQTPDRMQYFTILQYKLHLFTNQDDRSMRGLLGTGHCLRRGAEGKICWKDHNFCNAICSLYLMLGLAIIEYKTNYE